MQSCVVGLVLLKEAVASCKRSGRANAVVAGCRNFGKVCMGRNIVLPVVSRCSGFGRAGMMHNNFSVLAGHGVVMCRLFAMIGAEVGKEVWLLPNLLKRVCDTRSWRGVLHYRPEMQVVCELQPVWESGCKCN